MVLEKTLESSLDCMAIKPVHPKGNQSWIFIGRTDAEAETTIFWPPNVTNWLIRKDPGAGKDWRQEEKGTTEDEMAGWNFLTQWTWVWVKSGSWWWTGRPGVLQSMGSQNQTRLRLNWTELTVTVYLGFPGGSDGKESTCSVADLGITKGCEQIWGDKRYIHHFESSDGFTNIYLCKNSSNCMLCMCTS